MTKRVLFITGPPRSGKSTLAAGLAKILGTTQCAVLSTSSLCTPGPWKKLGAMYPDEQELMASARTWIDDCPVETVIVDGAPREAGQHLWADGLDSGIVVLTASRVPIETPVDMARHTRWYAVQVHEIAAILDRHAHFVVDVGGRGECWISAKEIAMWWKGMFWGEK